MVTSHKSLSVQDFKQIFEPAGKVCALSTLGLAQLVPRRKVDPFKKNCLQVRWSAGLHWKLVGSIPAGF
jgi:hypothetical protein